MVTTDNRTLDPHILLVYIVSVMYSISSVPEPEEGWISCGGGLRVPKKVERYPILSSSIELVLYSYATLEF